MALFRRQYHPSTRTMLKTGSLAILLASTSLSVSSAQTVVIGGSNSRPVTVNMSSAYGSQQGYVLQRRQSPFAKSTVAAAPVQTAPSTDFSKGAEIRYGEEVIKLVPPGSQPKRKAKPIVTKSVAKAKPVAKPEPTVAKAEPKQPAPTPAPIVKKAVVPEPAAPKPESKVAAADPTPTASPPKTEVPEVKTPPQMKPEPEVVAKTEPALPKAPEELKTVSQPVDITPKVEEAAKAPEPDKEIQVAAVEPKQTMEPVAEPAKQVEQAQTSGNEDIKQILFEDGETELPSSAGTKLEALAKSLADNNDRIQLVAYANASSNGTARRLSLGRALVIRSKLMDLGVPNNKIEVRALGKPTDSSPADRVDLKLVAR